MAKYRVQWYEPMAFNELREEFRDFSSKYDAKKWVEKMKKDKNIEGIDLFQLPNKELIYRKYMKR